MDEYISVEEAAELAGLTPAYIRRLARDNRIRAKRFGKRAWMIERASILEYKENAERLGPKKHSPWGRGRHRKSDE